MADIKVGDRVRMDTSQPEHPLYGPVPDLGVGTVVATEGEGLMEGWYVLVEWDKPTTVHAKRPNIDSLIKVEES